MKDLIAVVRNFYAANKREQSFVLAVLLVGTGIACSPLFSPGWFWVHDLHTHLHRIFATCHEMRLGDFYPRWLSQAAYGKGLPDLNFYSPAFYLVAGWFHLLVIPLEIVLKGLCFFLFFLGAWGMYNWMRRYCDVAGALIAAVLYLFTPYHFLDIYVRGAYPEFAALALLPWLFHALDLSFSPEKFARGITLTAITSAAIVLTHHLTALMVIPFAILYFGWNAISARTGRRQIFMAVLGPIFGAGLSAFYWLPMATEMDYLVTFQAMDTIRDHFVYPSQLFSLFWDFGASVAGKGDGMSFQIGAVLVGSGALACFTLPSVPRDERIFGIVSLALGMLGLLLTTSLSSGFYELVPPMHFFRHPWRFLALATMFLSAFSGLITQSRMLSKISWMRWLLFCAIFVACIVFSSDQRTVNRLPFDLDVAERESLEGKSIGGPDYDIDFLPKWVKYDPDVRILTKPWIWPSDNIATVTGVEEKGARMKFSLDAYRPVSIIIPWTYFPGWKMTVNGVSFPVDVDQSGFITFSLDAGVYNIRLWFGSTRPRIAGWAIAGVTFLIMCGFRLPQAQRRLFPGYRPGKCSAQTS